ncbi:hypothetical protein [Noviherbaspirillum saxi]|uniref:Uncharacterized protein n=1 Tax=Noviherbaspirillum saxi TaxID=2320863 RepID=A0A3A3G018_9BURK|nr:hypothetical protein [Noviherbaspirillum saxi]RJF92669.1 hypothetical protein D3871_29245 [Noviherbaspirillum saxi]
MERVKVQASYTVGADPTVKRAEFVARIKDSTEDYKLAARAQNAAARRENLPRSHINIIGCAGE